MTDTPAAPLPGHMTGTEFDTITEPIQSFNAMIRDITVTQYGYWRSSRRASHHVTEVFNVANVSNTRRPNMRRQDNSVVGSGSDTQVGLCHLAGASLPHLHIQPRKWSHALTLLLSAETRIRHAQDADWTITSRSPEAAAGLVSSVLLDAIGTGLCLELEGEHLVLYARRRIKEGDAQQRLHDRLDHIASILQPDS